MSSTQTMSRYLPFEDMNREYESNKPSRETTSAIQRINQISFTIRCQRSQAKGGRVHLGYLRPLVQDYEVAVDIVLSLLLYGHRGHTYRWPRGAQSIHQRFNLLNGGDRYNLNTAIVQIPNIASDP